MAAVPGSGASLSLQLAALGGLLLFTLSQVRADSSPRGLLLDAALVGPDVVAVGELGGIHRSEDYAKTWRRIASPVTALLTGVSFAPDRRHGWAVGHDAVILATTDGGRTWQKQWQDRNLENSFLDVLALDANTVFAVGAYGLFVSTTNGGKTWVSRKLRDDDLHLNRLTRGPTGTLYLAGEQGLLLRSTDRGQSWQEIPTVYEGSFYGILPLAAEVLLAYGLRGHVYRSDDDGRWWDGVPTEQPRLVATALRLSNDIVLLAGAEGAGAISRDGGRTFSPWSPAIRGGISELLELPDGHVLAVGEAGAVVVSVP